MAVISSPLVEVVALCIEWAYTIIANLLLALDSNPVRRVALWPLRYLIQQVVQWAFKVSGHCAVLECDLLCLCHTC